MLKNVVDTGVERVKISTISKISSIDTVAKKLEGIAGIKTISDFSQEYFHCFSYAFKVPFAKKELISALESIATFHEKSKQNDYIWYYGGGEPVHIGIVQDDGEVISQWGSGPILKHPVWSVPISYGSRVKYSDPIDFDIIKKYDEDIIDWHSKTIFHKFLPYSIKILLEDIIR